LLGLFEEDKIGIAVSDSDIAQLPGWIVACHLLNDEKYYMVSGEQLATDARFSTLQSGE
jgi:hypothetical protein